MVGSTGGEDGLDALFETLADEQRRRLVAFFADAPADTFSLDELVEVVSQYEQLENEPNQRRKIEIDLHHRQLPKLAAAGIIDYDGERDVVRYRSDDQSTITTDRILTSVTGLPAD